LPLYSAKENEMHNVFFGGIAQYYDSAGILVQDNNVPFVKTIARVTRTADGAMAEYKLPNEMPTLLGASAEFIPLPTVPQYNNEVFKLDSITADSTLVGYIFGGISSTAANIFFTNTGTQSIASSQIFKVYVIKNNPVGIHELNTHSNGSLKIKVFPNPNDGNFMVKFYLNKPTTTKISIYDVNGKLMEENVMTDVKIGENNFVRKNNGPQLIGNFILKIETLYEKAAIRIVIK
jgi:hypothetical protein